LRAAGIYKRNAFISGALFETTGLDQALIPDAYRSGMPRCYSGTEIRPVRAVQAAVFGEAR
jgi:hypothetical protein